VKIDVEGGTGSGDDFGGEQGVAAEFEEVVVDPDAIDFEDVCPDVGEELLDEVAGRSVGRVTAGRSGTGRAERSSLPLGVSGRASSQMEKDGACSPEGGYGAVLQLAVTYRA